MSLLELKLQPPQSEQLSQVVDLDRRCLGGLWSLEGYQRELNSPNSSLLVLSIPIEIDKSDRLLERTSLHISSPPNPTIANREQIVGFGCFWAILEEAHITLLMIHPEYQGQGLGQLLLVALLEDAMRRKLERATLEVRVSNKAAISLYKKFGFQVAGRRKGYYQETGEDASILWRGDLHRPEFAEEIKTWQKHIRDRLAQNQWKLEN
jgi:[ribosomal protein S18]-alanine N-acetyltransferase